MSSLLLDAAGVGASRLHCRAITAEGRRAIRVFAIPRTRRQCRRSSPSCEARVSAPTDTEHER